MHVAAAALRNRALAKCCLQLVRRSVTHEFDIDDFARSLQSDGVGQLTAVVDFLVVHPNDNVIDVQAGGLGRGPGFDG